MALKCVTKIPLSSPDLDDRILLSFGSRAVSLRRDDGEQLENYPGHVTELLFAASSVLQVARRAEFESEKDGCMQAAELLINLANELHKAEAA